MNFRLMIPANATRLLVNGRPRERVRTAVLHWNRTIEASHGGVNTKCDLSQPLANLSQNCQGFIINPADIPDPSWATTPSALARWRVAAFHDFTMSYHTVRSFDRTTGTLLFNNPAEIPYGLGGGSAKRWWIENAAEMRPAAGSGQWMLEYGATAEGTAAGLSLLYAPAVGEAPPTQHEIEVAVLGSGCESSQPWLGSSAALVWAHGQNPAHELTDVSFVGLRFTSTATWYQGDGGQPWLPWLFSSAVHVGTSRSFRMEGCCFAGAANGLMVIDSASATVERTAFDESGGVAFTFRNCRGCIANNSWVRGCSKEIYGAACVYYKGTLAMGRRVI
jgi:hypothetical protein